MKHPIQCVWISGASSGLGRALALQYAQDKKSLILSSRNKDALESVARACTLAGAPQTQVAPLDYAKTAACEAMAYKHAVACDAVILCAGLSQRAKATETRSQTLEYLMRINAITPMVMAQALFAQWRKRTYGQLAVVSSIASHAPVPLRSAYCAAKAALELHGATMHNEIAAEKKDLEFVRIIPGFIKTDISHKALTGAGVPWGKDDAQQQGGMECEKAARHIVKLLSKKDAPPKIYIGMNLTLHALKLLSKHMPRLANFILARSKTT